MKAKVTGLEGIVAADTEIGYVNGAEGKLVYRGYWAKDLAIRHTFEEAAYLLWYGELPDDSALRSLREQLKAHRILQPELKRLLDAMPKGTPMMNVLMAAVASLAEEDSEWPPKAEQAIRLTAQLPAIIAYRYRKVNGLPWLEPNEDCGHADYYLQLLFGHRPAEAHVRALNAYMILAMEHGLNASTFAARVVSSTESDLYAAVCAAIGAMKGPLHGGAPSGVIKLLEDIGEKERAEPHMRGNLEKGERLMGFGHRIYKTPDPRAEALRDVTAALSGDDPWLGLARHAERTAIRLLAEYKPERKLHTNVEFYAAAVMRAVQMPPQLFTPTFTAARVVGWTAHILEQAQINRIYRPQSVYVGAMPVEG
ncbi:citrate synthase/methylcitrate synthase [Paenibacillus contaminans]|uniref:Citrate synthase n=1 Tax=Paenibacillus contaminans TaxID=450362 RepID=A0A329MNV3_9BACL|nr:citrate synthase/methylcitrate synthase [Paenibacillus contaminans]RAV20986.1 citrate synthase/methylcitrate synthase [Paenibacillus contaminans]